MQFSVFCNAVLKKNTQALLIIFYITAYKEDTFTLPIPKLM